MQLCKEREEPDDRLLHTLPPLLDKRTAMFATGCSAIGGRVQAQVVRYGGLVWHGIVWWVGWLVSGRVQVIGFVRRTPSIICQLDDH